LDAAENNLDEVRAEIDKLKAETELLRAEANHREALKEEKSGSRITLFGMPWCEALAFVVVVLFVMWFGANVL